VEGVKKSPEAILARPKAAPALAQASAYWRGWVRGAF
jgi:hypothetical protein